MKPRDRWRELAGQAGRFGAVGAVNSALTYVLYVLLLFVMPYPAAYSLTFVVGLAFALVANAKLTFASRITVGGAGYFCLFYVLSYVLGLVLTVFFVEVFRVRPSLAPLAAMPITVPANFFGSRLALRRGHR
jgi:putative flippase GtrA